MTGFRAKDRRSVTVALMVEYEVEGDASAGQIGAAACSLLPALPQFHVKRTICTPVAVGILRSTENDRRVNSDLGWPMCNCPTRDGCWCDPKPEMADPNTSPFRVPSPGLVRCTCHEASGSFGCGVHGDA